MLILQDAASSWDSVEPGRPALRSDAFERISLWVVRSAGGREGFYFAFTLILAWVGAGPYFHFVRLPRHDRHDRQGYPIQAALSLKFGNIDDDISRRGWRYTGSSI